MEALLLPAGPAADRLPPEIIRRVAAAAFAAVGV